MSLTREYAKIFLLQKQQNIIIINLQYIVIGVTLSKYTTTAWTWFHRIKNIVL